MKISGGMAKAAPRGIIRKLLTVLLIKMNAKSSRGVIYANPSLKDSIIRSNIQIKLLPFKYPKKLAIIKTAVTNRNRIRILD